MVPGNTVERNTTDVAVAVKTLCKVEPQGVVMISDEQYQRLVGKAHQPQNLLQFFRESPLVGIELDLERDKDEGRDIGL